MNFRAREEQQSGGWVHWAILAFMGEEFLTISGGILSLRPSYSHDPLTAASWWGVAVLMALGLSLGIASLATRLYRRFTFPALCALVVLTSVAAIFSTSFFNGLYVAHLAETTEQGRDSEQRENEYDRLARETSVLVTKLSDHLAAVWRRAKQEEQQALEGARHEQEERLPLSQRGCGPICGEHLRVATRWRAEREQLEDTQKRLKQVPATPASKTWEDLLRFHTQVVGLLRSIPVNNTVELSLPAAPRPPAALTKGGNAQGEGGLAALTELALNRDFRNPQLALPLGLGLFCEYAVIVLVLGARPWRPCRVWAYEKLEHLEEMVDLIPALLPLLWHLLKRGFVKDDSTARQQRYARNMRQKALKETRQEVADLKEQDADLSRYYEDLHRNHHNGNARPQDTTE